MDAPDAFENLSNEVQDKINVYIEYLPINEDKTIAKAYAKCTFYDQNAKIALTIEEAKILRDKLNNVLSRF